MNMSGHKISSLIVIMLVQACLLHAKSLREVEWHSATEDGTSEAVVSSCTPEEYQMERFNKLYSTDAVNSFSGNAFYYINRATEIHNNRTETIQNTAEEDNAVIANITDGSRFTPAGMETANKIVCAKILQELDDVANEISDTALCGWDYICDYKAGRMPNYLFKARCRTSRCSNNCSQENNIHNMCQAHGIQVNILQMRGNCGDWVWGQELLPIACTCVHEGLSISQ